MRLRLCRSNDSIFHERSIVPGMAFIHYSFNFKWSFVDTFLGSCPDPCLWPGRYLSSSSLLQHDHLAHRLPYWKLGLKRCSVFRSLANGSPGVYVVSFVPPANYQCSLHGHLMPPSEISAPDIPHMMSFRGVKRHPNQMRNQSSNWTADSQAARAGNSSKIG